MKLTKTQFLLCSFMLFSLFFGAGNLIFPPYLGQHATTNMYPALFGFYLTAVILPVCGIIVVSKSGGLQNLANRVHPLFSTIFTFLIYLSIGPGLGIPRAASVPFEMAIVPYLPQDAPKQLYLLIFSILFFSIAYWFSNTPGKLIERIGKFLTPTLLFLMISLFVSFLMHQTQAIQPPALDFTNQPVLVGFLYGYQTMDAIAALNFGLVICFTMQDLGIQNDKDILSYTVKCGIVAGVLLMLIYFILSYMGAYTSGIFPLEENGALILKDIIESLFGSYGSILMISIFTLACLTTCIGLISSISKYFSTISKTISYQGWAGIISLISCILCNFGLNKILSFSVFVLNAIYPVAIVLILLGLFDHLFHKNPYVYPFVVYSTLIIALLFVLDSTHHLPSFLSCIRFLPFYKPGLGWVSVSLFFFVFALFLNRKQHNKTDHS